MFHPWTIGDAGEETRLVVDEGSVFRKVFEESHHDGGEFVVVIELPGGENATKGNVRGDSVRVFYHSHLLIPRPAILNPGIGPRRRQEWQWRCCPRVGATS